MDQITITYTSPFDFVPEKATVYPAYWVAAKVAKALNDDEATMDSGWSYPVVEYLGGWSVGVVDDDGEFLGRL